MVRVLAHAVFLTRPGGVVMSVHLAPVTSSTIVVAVDVGKTSVMLAAPDSARRRVFGPVECAMTRSELAATVHRVSAVVPRSAQVKVGIEAAGHYHRPVLDYRWPARVGGVGVQSSPCRRATSCGGPAASQDRCHRLGSDHRAGAGRPGPVER